MASFRNEFEIASLCLDERNQIGPHHLAIGKTRKLFERDGIIHAFFSRGYEIAYSRISADGLHLLETQALDFPVAWGGGSFCVDDDRAGSVTLVFLHRNQHEFCVARGIIESGAIRWDGWRTLLVSRGRQSAPWVEIGRQGTAWASVLERNGDFRLAVIPPEGRPVVGDLFLPGEEPWYHSCVQMLPVKDDLALAIGFRGVFPSRTELVFKTVSADLKLSAAETLAPCNVNDKLTFHFQAVGDPERGTAHIVYLDEGLSVSHARFEGNEWKVTRGILPSACFAPQICLNEAGDASLLAADYEGAAWSAAWSAKKGWSTPCRIKSVPVPNISTHFGQTGYGTGGMISAARSRDGRVPFLVGVVEDNHTARAKLHLAVLGHGEGLLLAKEQPLELCAADKKVTADIHFNALRPCDLQRPGRRWIVTVPAEAGRALKLAVTAGNDGAAAHAFWLERDGTTSDEPTPPRLHAQMKDAFSLSDAPASLRLEADLRGDTAALEPAQAWVEIYDHGALSESGHQAKLADIGPFDPETTAKLALRPERIALTFKRMV